MPRYLLDTNIVSFLLKRNPSVIQQFHQVLPEDIVLSAVVEAELRYGAARLPAGARLHAILPEFLNRSQILPWDSVCARQYGELRARLEAEGTPMGFFDTMIAAHGLAYGLTVVTNDQAFHRIGQLTIEDWTKAPPRA
jgi:tRNA(fMet)-specific endonuclease VapC